MAKLISASAPQKCQTVLEGDVQCSIVAKMYHSTEGVLGVLRVLRACCGPKFVLLI